MMYSATVSQLINSIESHSINFGMHAHESDSIGTQSIANSAHSAKSSASCKSISDPAALFSKAVLDLKRAAREASGLNEDLTEYWDTWNYWKKHPFVIGNDLLSGQLLLQHLLILTNLKYESSEELFEDLKVWLEKTSQKDAADLIEIRDQLCAGFFLIFCTNFHVARNHLNQVKSSLVSEYFEALESELIKRRSGFSESNVVAASSSIENLATNFSKSFIASRDYLQNLLLFFRDFAVALLEKMKAKHAILVHAIKSNAKAFLSYCQALLKAILIKLMRK